MIRTIITGCAGRMGRALVQAVNANAQMHLNAATVSPGHLWAGQDSGTVQNGAPSGLFITDSLTALTNENDVLIDFTAPTATLDHLNWCVAHSTPIVIGTTGFSEAALALIDQAAQEVPVLLAPNTSLGVNVCFELMRTAARSIGQQADIEIIEMHHRHKKDAPSGTALEMGKIIADTLGQTLKPTSHLNPTREAGHIGFSSVRAGDIVGEHTALFSLAGERIEITHRAQSRSIYADGALVAAKWLVEQPKGLYSMRDVLFE